jgi:hypothetical protein
VIFTSGASSSTWLPKRYWRTNPGRDKDERRHKGKDAVYQEPTKTVHVTKTECFAKVIPVGEPHLRSILREYVAHYHDELNDQGLGNVIPFPRAAPSALAGVRRCDRLGGLLLYYHRDAA